MDKKSDDGGERRLRKMILVSPEFIKRLRGDEAYKMEKQTKINRVLKKRGPDDQKLLHLRNLSHLYDKRVEQGPVEVPVYDYAPSETLIESEKLKKRRRPVLRKKTFVNIRARRPSSAVATAAGASGTTSAVAGTSSVSVTQPTTSPVRREHTVEGSKARLRPKSRLHKPLRWAYLPSD